MKPVWTFIDGAKDVTVKPPDLSGHEPSHVHVPIFPAQAVSFNGYVICDPAAIGVPHWFSIKVAQRQGSQFGWTDDAGEALQFARRQDAEDFAARYLPNMTVTIAGRNGH